MDIVIVLDGSNSIYPWYEVQDFLINILQKFYIGPGQTQVGSSSFQSQTAHGSVRFQCSTAADSAHCMSHTGSDHLKNCFWADPIFPIKPIKPIKLRDRGFCYMTHIDISKS